MKLAQRLALLFVVISIVPMLIVGYLAYENGRSTVEKQTVNHLVSTNLLKSNELYRWVLANRHSIEELAQRPLIKRYAAILTTHENPVKDYDEAHERIVREHFLPMLQINRGFIDYILLCPVHGVVLAASIESEEGKYRDHEPYYIRGREGTFLQGVHYSVSLQQPAMTVSTPIRDEQGKLLAVLAGRLDLKDLSAIMSAQSGLSESEDTYLVNASGFFCYRAPLRKGLCTEKDGAHTGG